MASTMMDGLIVWSGAILDRLMEGAPEEYEDDLAETVMLMVLPLLAFRAWAPLNDNDA